MSVRGRPGWRNTAPAPRCNCREVPGNTSWRWDFHKAACARAVELWNTVATRPGVIDERRR